MSEQIAYADHHTLKGGVSQMLLEGKVRAEQAVSRELLRT